MNHEPQWSSEGGGGGGRHDDDAALSEFLASLMDYYTPTIPDVLVEHYLARSGFQSPHLRLCTIVGCLARVLNRRAISFPTRTHACTKTTLVTVATQKFVAEVAGDALQRCKARQATIPKDKRDRQQKDKRLVLTMEDLTKALHDYGVNVRHQEYFADSPSTGMDPATRDE